MKKTVFLFFVCIVIICLPVRFAIADGVPKLNNIAGNQIWQHTPGHAAHYSFQTGRNGMVDVINGHVATINELISHVEKLEEEVAFHEGENNDCDCECCDQDDSFTNFKDEIRLRLADLEKEIISLKRNSGRDERGQEHGGDL